MEVVVRSSARTGIKDRLVNGLDMIVRDLDLVSVAESSPSQRTSPLKTYLLVARDVRLSAEDRLVVRVALIFPPDEGSPVFGDWEQNSVPGQVWVWLANAHRVLDNPMNRLDGRDKVTGTAVFASECAP